MNMTIQEDEIIHSGRFFIKQWLKRVSWVMLVVFSYEQVSTTACGNCGQLTRQYLAPKSGISQVSQSDTTETTHATNQILQGSELEQSIEIKHQTSHMDGDSKSEFTRLSSYQVKGVAYAATIFGIILFISVVIFSDFNFREQILSLTMEIGFIASSLMAMGLIWRYFLHIGTHFNLNSLYNPSGRNLVYKASSFLMALSIAEIAEWRYVTKDFFEFEPHTILWIIDHSWFNDFIIFPGLIAGFYLIRGGFEFINYLVGKLYEKFVDFRYPRVGLTYSKVGSTVNFVATINSGVPLATEIAGRFFTTLAWIVNLYDEFLQKGSILYKPGIKEATFDPLDFVAYTAGFLISCLMISWFYPKSKQVERGSSFLGIAREYFSQQAQYLFQSFKRIVRYGKENPSFVALVFPSIVGFTLMMFTMSVWIGGGGLLIGLIACFSVDQIEGIRDFKKVDESTTVALNKNEQINPGDFTEKVSAFLSTEESARGALQLQSAL